jgi:hypothetical protein
MVGAALGLGLLWQPATAAGGDIPFRAACDLADVAAVSGALGLEVTVGTASAQQSCEYQAGGTTVATTILEPSLVLALLHLGSPTAAVLTVADRPALTTPDNGSGSAMTAVALDDGGLLTVYVPNDAGVPEPQTASSALAEALLAAGPVTAHLPASDVPAVEFVGKPCELLTLAELKQILGKEFKTAPRLSTGGGCAWQTKSARQPIYVGTSFSQVALAIMRSGNFQDTEAAGRPAVFLPDSTLLFVDAGGGSVLNLYLSGAPGSKKKQRDLLVRIAEAAFARMTPVVDSGPPDCALLAVDVANSITGLTLNALPGLGTESCFLVGPDQLTAILLTRSAAADPDAAWEAARPTFPGLGDPTQVDVAGHAANVGETPLGSAIAVDLDGLPGGDGQVLAVVVSDFPEGTDTIALAQQLAAAAIDAM